MKAALLVVDMSVEQVAALSPTRTRTIVKAIQQLSAANLPWTLQLDSRLWLASPDESTLSTVYPEWGVTMGIPDSPGAALIPELLLLSSSSPTWQFVPKKNYSSFVDSPLLDLLRQYEITHLFITGINTDYCIFNTAMDSFARAKVKTYVVEQGVGSISGRAGHEQGLSWIRAHLGPQAVVSVQQVVNQIFDWCIMLREMMRGMMRGMMNWQQTRVAVKNTV